MPDPAPLRLYLASRALSVLGLQVLASAFVFRAVHLGAGPYEIGKLGFFATLASLLTSLALGSLVDRICRKKAILVSHALLFLFALGLWAYGARELRALYWAAALLAVFRNFRSISQFAVFGEVLRGVPDSHRWVNLSTLSWQCAAFVAPILGGFVDSSGSNLCFGLAVALFLAAFACQSLVVRALGPKEVSRPAWGWREVGKGLLANERLFSSLILDFAVVLLAGSVALLPFLHPGQNSSVTIGLLRSAMPAGVIVGTTLVLNKALARDWVKWLFVATFGFGAANLLLAGSTSVALSLCLLLIAGFFDAISLSVRETILQQEVPNGAKGRIYSLNNFLVNASDELSEWESGLAAEWLGVRASLRWGAGLTVLICLVFGARKVVVPKARLRTQNGLKVPGMPLVTPPTPPEIS